MLAALSLAVLGAGALLRDGEDGERDEVARYIVGVNRIQGGFSSELTRVNRVYASFRAAPTAPARQLTELRDAEQTLEVVTQQIKGLEVPDGAARLHDELVRLVALQLAFAQELTQLAEYLPRLTDAEREPCSGGRAGPARASRCYDAGRAGARVRSLRGDARPGREVARATLCSAGARARAASRDRSACGDSQR